MERAEQVPETGIRQGYYQVVTFRRHVVSVFRLACTVRKCIEVHEKCMESATQPNNLSIKMFWFVWLSAVTRHLGEEKTTLRFTAHRQRHGHGTLKYVDLDPMMRGHKPKNKCPEILLLMLS